MTKTRNCQKSPRLPKIPNRQKSPTDKNPLAKPQMANQNGSKNLPKNP